MEQFPGVETTTIGGYRLRVRRVPDLAAICPDAPEGLMYVRCRPIDGDAVYPQGEIYPVEELEVAVGGMVGVPVFVNGRDEDIQRAVGRVVHAEVDPVERCVMATLTVDGAAYPDLARGIREGYITDTAATSIVGHSVCSVCGHRAERERDWCEHIRMHRGQHLDGETVLEINRELRFTSVSILSTGAFTPYMEVV